MIKEYGAGANHLAMGAPRPGSVLEPISSFMGPIYDPTCRLQTYEYFITHERQQRVRIGLSPVPLRLTGCRRLADIETGTPCYESMT